MQELVDKFIENPNLLHISSGKLINRGNKIFKDFSPEQINEAKVEARNRSVEPLVSTTPFLKEAKENDKESVYTYISQKALSPKELDDLVQADNINFRRGQTWYKQNSSGTWTYSISVIPLLKNFYSEEELRTRLKELFPKQSSPLKFTPVSTNSENALIVLLSDDHAGAVNTTNIFNSTVLSYEEKMELAAKKVLLKVGKEKFEELHIISLGDQLNGWNSLTTRGGHEVKSLSNKEQFDIYVKGRKIFYDLVIGANVSNTVYIREVENSNHSGLGFSYMANQYLKMYLEAKFPHVILESMTELIGGFDFGIHTIMYTHGKDETYMKRPMPLIADPKTDLFMFQYLNNRNYNPSDKTKSYTLYKGDLHQFSIQKPKFGRYVNVPSITGNTDYSDANYGDTEAGILVEIINKYCKDIDTKLLSL